jgi:hypothetical protein
MKNHLAVKACIKRAVKEQLGIIGGSLVMDLREKV